MLVEFVTVVPGSMIVQNRLSLCLVMVQFDSFPKHKSSYANIKICRCLLIAWVFKINDDFHSLIYLTEVEVPNTGSVGPDVCFMYFSDINHFYPLQSTSLTLEKPVLNTGLC